MRKTLALAGSILLFTSAALAQSPRTVPCIVDVATTGADGKHVAEWKPREAIRGVFKIPAGEQIVMPFTMPAEGNCEAHVLAFESRKLSEIPSLLNPSPGKPPVETELPSAADVIILDQQAMDARNREEKYESRFFQSRAADGQLNIQLPAGDYFMIVSNKNAEKIPLKVFVWLGHTEKFDLSEN